MCPLLAGHARARDDDAWDAARAAHPAACDAGAWAPDRAKQRRNVLIQPVHASHGLASDGDRVEQPVA